MRCSNRLSLDSWLPHLAGPRSALCCDHIADSKLEQSIDAKLESDLYYIFYSGKFSYNLACSWHLSPSALCLSLDTVPATSSNNLNGLQILLSAWHSSGGS